MKLKGITEIQCHQKILSRLVLRGIIICTYLVFMVASVVVLKNNSHKMIIKEMKISRWIHGHTKIDKIKENMRM